MVRPEEIGFGISLDFVDQVLEHPVRVQEDIVGIAVGDLLVEYCVELFENDIVEPDLGRFLQPHRQAKGEATTQRHRERYLHCLPLPVAVAASGMHFSDKF